MPTRFSSSPFRSAMNRVALQMQHALSKIDPAAAALEHSIRQFKSDMSRERQVHQLRLQVSRRPAVMLEVDIQRARYLGERAFLIHQEEWKPLHHQDRMRLRSMAAHAGVGLEVVDDDDLAQLQS